MKKCSKCGCEKDVSEFNKQKTSKYGVRGDCKQCQAEHNTEYYTKNKDKIAENNAEYYANNKDKIAERKAEYYAKNKEKLAEQHAEYYAKNKEKIAEQTAKYRKTNAERIKIWKQRRRARKQNLPDTLTLEQWNDTLEYFESKCANCGSEEKICQDHFIPLSSPDCPGTTKCNMVPLCQGCNCSKHDKEPETFFSEAKFNFIFKYLQAFI